MTFGTLDGTTAVGTKVVVTYGPVASAGAGTVSIINADGTGGFTGPDQTYFYYPVIVAPGAYSSYRTWKVHVPNTVTEVTIGVTVFTDFPAEQNVAVTPPDTLPIWIYADSNIAAATPDYPGRFVKNVALVMFDLGAALSDRQLAVAKVGGEVIGGVRITSSDGMYVLRLDVSSAADLFAKLDTLRALPQVRTATPEAIIDRGFDYSK